MAGVNKYKDGVVGGLYKGLQGLIKSRGITVVAGEWSGGALPPMVIALIPFAITL